MPGPASHWHSWVIYLGEANAFGTFDAFVGSYAACCSGFELAVCALEAERLGQRWVASCDYELTDSDAAAPSSVDPRLQFQPKHVFVRAARSESQSS